jgi:L-amino acid N-acyltransferase YncA
MSINICVRAATAKDADVIAHIYNYYIRNTVITFEEEPVSAQTMEARVADVQKASLPWLVAEVEGALAGYAYANKWKPRSAYRYSVEAKSEMEIALGKYVESLLRGPQRTNEQAA